MIVVISSMGKDINSEVSPVFARCPYFIFAEVENKEIKKVESVKNDAMKQFGGAGIRASQKIAEKKAEVLITGNIGPKASMVLKQFNIRVYRGVGTAKDSLNKFIENKLERIP